jgi:hypothetical protein
VHVRISASIFKRGSNIPESHTVGNSPISVLLSRLFGIAASCRSERPLKLPKYWRRWSIILSKIRKFHKQLVGWTCLQQCLMCWAVRTQRPQVRISLKTITVICQRFWCVREAAVPHSSITCLSICPSAHPPANTGSRTAERYSSWECVLNSVDIFQVGCVSRNYNAYDSMIHKYGAAGGMRTGRRHPKHWKKTRLSAISHTREHSHDFTWDRT